MPRLLSFCLFLAVVSPAVAQKHPFTFEDMMKLKRVEEPAPSPDGKWVLFAAVDVDLAANTKTPHVWVVPLTGKTNPGGVPHPSPEGRVGGDEREIISGQDADRPRWAPDSKRFAFVSKKEGGSQIWIADFDGAAGTVTGVHKLTSITTEADGELWSPDGKNILFKSDVYPECDGAPTEEAACNAKKLEDVKNSKVKALVFTHLLYRHWNAYKEGKRTHLFVIPAGACVGAGVSPAQPGEAGQSAEGGCSNPRDLTPGDFDAPPLSLGGQDDYAFSPDGQEICYTSNHDPEPAISTNKNLWIVPVRVGAGDSPAAVIAATKNITAENKASDSTPLYSPDGKYIAYRAQQRPGDESDRLRLMLYDRKTGEKKNITEMFDGWVGAYAWGNDSNQIVFVSEDRGESPIYEVRANQPFPNFQKRGAQIGWSAIARGFNDDVAIAGDGRTVVFTTMSLRLPNEIQTLDLEALKHKQGAWDCPPGQCPKMPEPTRLTRLNDSLLSQIFTSPLESFWFTGAHGDKVQGFLVKPPNFDPAKKYPVKFIVHGGPEVPMGDEWSYRWNFQLFAANGYVVIFINFHGSPGYGQKFIDSINGDWGGAPFEDLMKGLDYAEEHYGFIDKDRECALGASYGGYMVNWILGHTNRFKCLVSHDGMFNAESAWGATEELWFNEWEFKGTPYTNREMYRKWSPHEYAANFKTPTLVIHGQLDYRLDVSQAFDLFTTLQRLGVPSKMLYFPDEGHWVLKPQNSQLWYKTVNDWVDQWVGR